MKVWAFALAALVAAVAAAILIPTADRPADVRSVASPAATDEPAPEATVEPSPSPSPTATARPVAAGDSGATAQTAETPEPERRRDRSGGRTTITVVEGEHSDGCEGSLEDEDDEEEALEDCED